MGFKINAFDKIMFEEQKKRKYKIKDFFLHKSPSKRSFRYRIHSWCQRKRWHHLPYMAHIASWRV